MTEPQTARCKALFISYDGVLDPLGGSQILPYVRSLQSAGYEMSIVSFEKPQSFAADGKAMQSALAAEGIGWEPLGFTASFGPAGKLWDLARMYRAAWRRARRTRVHILHSRGHPAAQVARFVKRRTGARFLFDFRGLWVDERVDKGGWNLSRLLDRLQYRHFKRTERRLLGAADHVVVLTEAVVPEIRRLGLPVSTGITVIPCCADFDHFPLAAPLRAQSRSDLGLSGDGLVLAYLGSVGRMYMLDRLCRLFEIAASQNDCLQLLLISRDREAMERLLAQHLPPALHKRITIASASRDEVPRKLAAADILVSFILPSYARMAASPTKLAESFAMGIPVVTNSGCGDVADQVIRLDAGIVVDPADDAALAQAARTLEEICAKGGARLRDAAQPVLSLDHAAARYAQVYRELEEMPC